MQTKEKCLRCGGRGYLPTREALKRRREKKNVSLRRLAPLMKVSAGYLCQLENGKQKWSADMVNRFDVAIEQIDMEAV